MGEAIFELEQVLRSKQEKLTSQETNVLMACKADALREFTVGGTVAAGVTWLVLPLIFKSLRLESLLGFGFMQLEDYVLYFASTFQLVRDSVCVCVCVCVLYWRQKWKTLLVIKLHNPSEMNVGGAAVISSFWRFGRSLDSSVEHILSADGSRMQMELSKIILRKYGDDSTPMQLITKHFYSEKVFDDSSADQPKIRWRYRNFFSDNVAFSQRTHNSDAHGYGETTDPQKTDMENADEPNCVLRSPVLDATTNPFDDVFGVTGSSEEIHHTNTSVLSPKRHGRSHKRSHRRHRMRHHEASSKIQHS
ncbi:hypothetical protein RHMOL_Rhmol02G0026900 [Rhododendron molle]|uniref:Uncharacterized protein n=1 Tax=Rhododendron molle TaxID=49168 RepID=A0ACC0PKP1_RHOML|nr:hypothetical protein RHMOL_Rhmol02G0026900 [Rhododendron molle]